MISSPAQRLLAGPSLDGRPEGLAAHVARLGELPTARGPRDVVDEIDASGLLGRGGAGFPTGRKWRALAEREHGAAVVVANGAEGEPASFKDRVLMVHRPHLVIDGAVLAAAAIEATEIVFYVGSEHVAAVEAMRRAIAERIAMTAAAASNGPAMRLVLAPISYVAGEATAVVNCINRGDARPTTTPPRVSEVGVAGRPTLVQNVESLAAAALIARFGERWWRSAGHGTTRGTSLITVSGGRRTHDIREVELGTTVGEIAAEADAAPGSVRAVILGGYFGTWARADAAWDLPLDPAVMKDAGLAFGCGIVGFLPTSVCGVVATAEIMAFLARESAGQCGPCLFGLKAIGESATRLARGAAGMEDLARIEHLAAQVAGRGACHHPDGAAQLMASAVDVFGDEYVRHARTGRCSVTGGRIEAA